MSAPVAIEVILLFDSMLEYLLGSEQWKRALNHYLKNHAYANVETNDLQQAIRDKLGLNLDWFFDEWILRGGEPHYRINYSTIAADDNWATEIVVEQIHKTDETVHYFKMPIVFEVHYTDGSFDSKKQMIEEAFSLVKIENPNKKKIAYVLFDPSSNIIKQVTFNKSFETLKAQFEKASNYLDRYDALLAMRDIAKEQKRTILLSAFDREKHYGIINEIIAQLADDNDEKTIQALMKLSKYPKAAVRDFLFKSVKLNDGWKPAFEEALTDSSYDVVKTVLEKLAYQYPVNITRYLALTANTYGMNNSVKIKWLEISMYKGGNRSNALQSLVQYAGPGFEFRTRLLAFASLKAANHINDELAGYMFQAMLSTNSRLAGPATDLMNYFATQMEVKEGIKFYFNKQEYAVADKEMLLKQLPWLKN